MVEPPRTQFCHMSSGWFDCTEPSLSTSLQGQQGMQGVVHLFGVVQAHRTSLNLLKPHHCKVCRVLSHEFRGGSTVPNLLYLHRYRDSKVCRVLMHLFGVVQAHRTLSNLLEPHHYRYSKVFRVSSGWFDCKSCVSSHSLCVKVTRFSCIITVNL